MRAQTFIAHLPYYALSKSESSPFEIMRFRNDAGAKEDSRTMSDLGS